jgi:hypothetical protein
VFPEPAYHVHELSDFFTPLRFIIPLNGLGHTGVQMVLHHQILHAAKRAHNRADLREHVHAVAIVCDHPSNAGYLTLNPLQPILYPFFVSLIQHGTFPV